MQTFILLTFILTLSAFAEGDAASKFSKKKSKVLEELTRKAQEIEKAKTCVSQATEKGSLKECTKELHKGMKNIKARVKQEKKENRRSAQREKKEMAIKKIDEKIKKLQAKKLELQQ